MKDATTIKVPASLRDEMNRVADYMHRTISSYRHSRKPTHAEVIAYLIEHAADTNDAFNNHVMLGIKED